MNVSDQKHPHHAVWCEHVQSVLDGNPKAVECAGPNHNDWQAYDRLSSQGVCNSYWEPSLLYRIARPMVTRTITYPAPITEISIGDAYYTTSLVVNVDGYYRFTWCNNDADKRYMKAGLVFATKEDAQAASQAIFGAQE